MGNSAGPNPHGPDRRNADRRRTRRGKAVPSRKLGFECLEERQLLATDVGVQFQYTDKSTGQVATTLQPNHDYTLTTYVQDTRTTPQGVLSAYFNLSFDSSVASPTGNVTVDPGYSLYPAGSVTAGNIAEAGGENFLQIFSNPGNSVPLFSVPMHVNATSANALVLSVGLVSDAANPTRVVKLVGTSANEIYLSEFTFAGNSTPIASGDTTVPVAVANAASVASAASSYAFSVQYSDNVAVKYSTIGNSNVIVTGPNGYSDGATLVSVDQSGDGTPRSATYSITPPGGSWDPTDNGTYTVVMVGSRVSDTSNNYVAAGNLTTFSVNVPDTLAPLAAANVSNVTGVASSYTFAVTYTDNVEIKVLTLDNADVRVLGPNGYNAAANLQSVNSLTDGTPRIATYAITPPNGAWSAAANGTYTVVMQANQVSDTSNNYVAAGNLATFSVTLDGTPPTANLTLGNAPLPGNSPYTFTVTYQDNAAVLGSSLGNQNLVVREPSGNQTATLLSRSPSAGDASSITGTYQIPAPNGVWGTSADGTYTIALAANQVSDTSNNYVAGGNLGSFTVNLDTTPPIANLTLGNAPVPGNSPYTFTVTYQDNVAVLGSSVGNQNLVVQGPTGNQPATLLIKSPTSGNASSVTGTYQILAPSGGWGTATSGTYTIALVAGQVSDTSNNYVAGGNLGAFTVNLDTTLPSANLTLGNAPVPGNTPYTFMVTYQDNVSVLGTSLGNQNIVVREPSGNLAATLLSRSPTAGNAASVTGTYQIPAPGGGWGTSSSGNYVIMLVANQVSDTSNNYVASGNLGSFTVNLDTTLPTANLTLGNAPVPGNSPYTFTVTYQDNVSVLGSSLGNQNIVVREPNGNLAATLLSRSPTSGDASSITGTYQIPAPNGVWGTSADGTYTIALLGNQVSDTSNNYVAGGNLGSFTVNLDTTLPTANLTLGNAPVPGNSPYTFSVTYQDNVSVLGSSLGNLNLVVIEPSGNQAATLLSRSPTSGNASSVTGTYQIPAPAGGWSTGTSGNYVITLAANQVSDTSNNYVAAGTLGTLTVNLDTLRPTANLSLGAPPVPGNSPYTFTVTYQDNVAVLGSSVGNLNLVVQEPSGNQAAVLLNKSPASGNAASVVATYQIPAPGAGWSTGTSGSYVITLMANQVSDTSNNYVVAGNLGNFSVNLDTVLPTASLTLGNAPVPGNNPYTFTVTYQDNVAVWGSSLGNQNLVVQGPGGNQTATLLNQSPASGNAAIVSGTYQISAPGGGWGTATNGNYVIVMQANQVRDTSNNAVAAGNLGLFSVNLDTLSPTASLTLGNAPVPGNSPYTFTVTYQDNVSVLGSSLGNLNLVVMEPSGNHAATLLDQAPASGNAASIVATYQIPAPMGGWGTPTNGSYVIVMQANQVRDTSNNYVAAGNLGALSVNLDTIRPTANLTLGNAPTPGNGPYQFTVTYQDNVAVRGASLGNLNVVVAEPGGNRAATLVSRAPSAGDAASVTGTYQIPAPAGGWNTAANGNYVILLVANQVSDTSNNYVPGGTLGTLAYNVDTIPPAGTLRAANVTTGGGTSYQFSVTWTDNAAVNAATLGNANLRVVGPKGNQAATLLNVAPASGNGTPLVATYQMPVPDGAWDAADNGTYIVLLNANQVQDTSGNPAATGGLGAFSVNVVPTDTQPPAARLTVGNVTVGGGGNQVFTVTYTDNVALDVGSLGNANVDVTGPNGYNQLATFLGTDQPGNGTPRVATYEVTAPHGGWSAGDAGAYTITLQGNQVHDTSNNFAGGGILGTFTVNAPQLDLVPPQAAADVSSHQPAVGDTSYTFQVTYLDNVAVASSTFSSANVNVTGPHGQQLAVTLLGVSPPGDGTPRVATYGVAGPGSGGVWDSGATSAGTYTVSVGTSPVYDTSGNPLPNSPAAVDVLGTFNFNLGNSVPSDVSAPRAEATAADITASGNGTYSFQVTYLDDRTLNLGALGNDNVNVNRTDLKYTQNATFDNVVASGNNTWIATYHVTAPGSVWQATDRGTYRITMLPSSVNDGTNYVPAGDIGSFGVYVGGPIVDLNGLAAAGTDYAVPYATGAAPVAIEDPALAALTDAAANSLTTLNVNINDFADGDALSYTQPLPTGVMQTSSSPGVLAFSGAATPAAYQALLRSIAFSTTDYNANHATRTITFLAADSGNLSSNTATTTVTLQAGAAPVANADAYTTPVGQELDVPAPGVLGNDTSVGNQPLQALLNTAPTNGWAILRSDNSLIYVPRAAYRGYDQFTYVAQNVNGNSSPANVTIAVGNAPLAGNDTYVMPMNGNLTTLAGNGVLANDNDPDGLPLAAGNYGNPAHGTLVGRPDGSFTYLPNANFRGYDAFTYQAIDANFASGIATVTIRVGNLPSVANDGYTTTVNGNLTIDAANGVLANDVDPDGAPLAVGNYTQPAHGAVSVNANGSFTYLPNANFRGNDSFTYWANDTAFTSANFATVTLRVGNLPVVVNDAYATVLGGNLVEDAANGVLSNDIRADGVPLTVANHTSPAHGNLTLNPDGSFTYVPNGNFRGNDSFTYWANDTAFWSAGVATVTIRVGNLPVVANDAYATTLAGNLSVDAANGVLSNDTRGDGVPMTVANHTNPAHGNLTINANGAFIYLPNAGYRGNDSFTYFADDTAFWSANAATVALRVGNLPVLANAAYATTVGGNLVVDAANGMLHNDIPGDGSTLTVGNVSLPAYGNLTWNANGAFDYVPGAGYRGNDSFTYWAVDPAFGPFGPVTVFLRVGNLPVVANDAYATTVGGNLAIPANGVLANDTPGDGVPMTVGNHTNPAHGNLAINPDGSFTYIPQAGYRGNDSFSYFANDTAFWSANAATVTIRVGNLPQVANDAYSVTMAGNLTVNAASGVLHNDTPADGVAITVANHTNPAHGNLTLNPDGSFNYVPNANFRGNDSFTYWANDTAFTSANFATVTLRVGNAPIVVDDAYATVLGGNLVLNAANGVLHNDIPGDGMPLTVANHTSPAHGNLTINPDGSFTYAPDAGYRGNDSFTYWANDTAFTSANFATVTLRVGSLPVAANDAYATPQGQPLSVAVNGVLTNDTDPDGLALTVGNYSQAAHGNVTVQANGAFLYTANAGFRGYDSFTYQAQDANFTSNTATVTIAVGNVPLANPDWYNTSVGQTLSIAANGVLGNDSDPDRLPLTVGNYTQSAHGNVTVNANGAFVYTPNAGFRGNDTFTYQAEDANLNSNFATVTIRVGNLPVANPDWYSTPMGQSLTVPANGVLGNDVDSDGLPLSVANSTQPGHGNVTLAANGALTYTPASGFRGNDSFTYSAQDANFTSNATTVTIRVGNLPVAANDTYSIAAGQTLSVPANGVLINDSDPDGLALTVGGNTQPAHGNLTLSANGSFVYTPNSGYTGVDSFTYQAQDANFTSNTATVRILVGGGPPQPAADSYATPLGTKLTEAAPGVLTNDTDPLGLPLSVANNTAPAHGNLANGVNANGSFSYTPNAGFRGNDTFNYQVTNGYYTANTTVTIRVGNLPVAANDAYTTTLAGNLTVQAVNGVLANDSDPDGLSLTVGNYTQPAHGNVTMGNNGAFVYTPAAGFRGNDTFTYWAQDANFASNVATVTIRVGNLPVANPDWFSTPLGQTLSIPANGVLGNDVDSDGLTLTVANYTQPAHGNVIVSANGAIRYTPNAGFRGNDTFTYTAQDANFTSGPANVTIRVGNLPVAANDAYTTTVGGNLTVQAANGVLANDTDPDGLSLSVGNHTQPAHGNVTVAANGSFVYTPDAGYVGNDSFTYTAQDANFTSSPATVSIRVGNQPVANNDFYATPLGQSLSVSAAGVLANDTDPNGLSLSVGNYSQPAHGNVTVSANGSIVYTPVAGFRGNDAFTYTAQDAAFQSNPATVTIRVGNLPSAGDDFYSTAMNQPLNVAASGVLGNDTAADGMPLSIGNYTQPAHGNVTLAANGALLYTPNSGFRGNDTFTYQVQDANFASNYANVTIRVGNLPTANPDFYSTPAGQALNVSANGVLGNDVDSDGLALSVGNYTQPTHGTLTLNANGSFSYAPAAGFHGNDTFTYRASDVNFTSGPANVTIQVGVPPVANNDFYQTSQGVTLTVPATSGVLANDTNAGSDTLTAVKQSDPAHGTLTLNADGSFTYAPAAGYTGADSFTYLANDTDGNSNAATVNLTISGTGTGSVSGEVFVDANRSRSAAGHLGMPGVTVRLDRSDISGWPEETRITHADGSYAFSNLPPGNYTVSEDPPSKYVPGVALAGTAGGNGTTNVISGIGLSAGQAAQNYDFTTWGLKPQYVTQALFQSTTLPASATAMANADNPVVGPAQTLGIFDPSASTFYLRNTNTTGVGDAAAGYGQAGAGWKPIAGDWTGGGTTTIGLYDPTHAEFYLKYTNTTGYADNAFSFGTAGSDQIPIAGDWNGDGTTTIGLFDPATATFTLRNSNAAGAADLSFAFGTPGKNLIPLAGDWTHSGIDSVGVYDPATATFYLRNTNSAGPADESFVFGSPRATPVAGDWNGDGTTTVGVFLPGTSHFLFTNTNAAGAAQIDVGYGVPGANWLPVMGQWTSTSGYASQMAVSAGPGSTAATAVTDATLAPIVQAAIARWQQAGAPAAALQAMANAHVAIADLPGLEIGRTTGTQILIDRNAAGNGWFIDPTPMTDEEYAPAAGGTEVATRAQAADHLDLLTTVAHELGHVAGLPDLDASSTTLMDGALEDGIRRMPGATEADTLAGRPPTEPGS